MPPDGAVALVTGAGSGIGRALAVELSRRRARIVLVGRRRAALAETLRRMAVPGRASCVSADLTKASDRAAVVDAIAGLGRLDLLVNNAGVIRAALLDRTDDGGMEAMLATNVLAPFALSRDLLPYLRQGEAPRIVNVGSMFGDIAMPHFVAYSATKFALRGLSDGLRRELGPYGVAVTYAAPRAVRTEALPAFSHLVAPLGLRLDEPAAVARRILDAAAAGRRSVYPTGNERLYVLLARLCPRLVDRAIAGQLRRVPRAE